MNTLQLVFVYSLVLRELKKQTYCQFARLDLDITGYQNSKSENSADVRLFFCLKSSFSAVTHFALFFFSVDSYNLPKFSEPEPLIGGV